MSAMKWTRTGAPLAAEAAPSPTTPDADMLGPVPRPSSSTESVWVALLDGTSATVQLWFECSAGVWLAIGAPLALLVGAAQVVTVPSGVKIFPQVTAAAGNPTKIAAGTITS